MVKQAVELEKQGQHRASRDLYLDAAERLSAWRATRKDDEHSRAVGVKVTEYRKRALNLTEHYSTC